MQRKGVLLAATVVLVATLGGCAAYVNVPAIGGDTVAAHETNWRYVADAMAVGANAVVVDRPINRPFLVVLPKGSTVLTYNRVLPQLGANATWLGPDAAGEASPVDPAATAATAPASKAALDVIVPPPATMPVDRPVVDVRQVRIRGWTAQIDVVRPLDGDQPQGVHQVVTAYLKWDPVSHWQAEQIRAWRTSVDTALIRSPYAETPESVR